MWLGPWAGPSAGAGIAPPSCSPSTTPTIRGSAKWQLGSLIHERVTCAILRMESEEPLRASLAFELDGEIHEWSSSALPDADGVVRLRVPHSGEVRWFSGSRSGTLRLEAAAVDGGATITLP